MTSLLTLLITNFVGNMHGKRANLGPGVTRKQSKPNFPKINISYPVIRTRGVRIRGQEMFAFQKKLACIAFL